MPSAAATSPMGFMSARHYTRQAQWCVRTAAVVMAARRCHDSSMVWALSLLLPAVLWTTVLASDPEVRAPDAKVPREAPANEDSVTNKPDEYPYVEEIPQVVTKVAPVYPPDAAKAGIQGTVMLQVLVGKDGLVKQTRIASSTPALDAAAQTAVRQWVFKPALDNGKPTPVWVALPMKFTLRGTPANPTRAAFDSTWTLLRHAGVKPP